jgi:hypothetical protein
VNLRCKTDPDIVHCGMQRIDEGVDVGNLQADVRRLFHWALLRQQGYPATMP